MLLAIAALTYSCGGGDSSGAASQSAGDESSRAPAGGPSGPQPTDGSTGEPTGAATGGSPDGTAPGGEGLGDGTAATPTSTTSTVDGSLCTDEELLVTPVPDRTELPRGATMQIKIKIKNVSDRTCSRDVGASLQELYIVVAGGADKIWSSDDCGGATGHSVESFTPGFERAYTATWNGRETAKCGDVDSRPMPEAGDYQIYGRLGTKRGKPVTITLT